MKSAENLCSRIEQLVVESDIENFLRTSMGNVSTSDDVLCFFRRFALYNQPFPGGVVSLAGAVHLRSDLFRDPAAEIDDNADRSSVIASNIFFAAEDEFASPDRRSRVTHRQMAQDLVRAIVRYVDLTPQQFNDRFAGDRSHEQMHQALRDGYRTTGAGTDAELFRGIGFHLGSERLASVEFTVIHEHLRANFPELIDYSTAAVYSSGRPAYNWIVLHANVADDRSHVSVEVDHYALGLVGAGDAMDYYCGSDLRPEEVEANIIAGFLEFVAFQRTMFASLNKRE